MLRWVLPGVFQNIATKYTEKPVKLDLFLPLQPRSGAAHEPLQLERLQYFIPRPGDHDQQVCAHEVSEPQGLQ